MGKVQSSSAASDRNLIISDITNNDVSTSKHGFTPKAPNSAGKFLRGDATWAGTLSSSVVVNFNPLANTDLTSSTLTTWLTLGTITVPSWATSALVDIDFVDIFGNSNTSTSHLQVFIGTDGGALSINYDLTLTTARYAFGWKDTVTLSSTGSQSLTVQGLRNSGTGNLRAGTYSTVSTRIDFLP